MILVLSKRILFQIFFCFVFVFFTGCYYDNVDELYPSVIACDTTGTVSYATDIAPILLNSCGSQNSSCHASASAQSGYGLGSYNDLIATINGSGIFLETIIHSPTINSSKWMPKNSTSKIDDCSIQKITAWLNNGKLNN